MPGLAYDYKMTDWDGDGRIDILANLRRGGGIVFYKNIGSQKEPLFRSLQENDRIMAPERFGLGRYFDVLDIDQDGRMELVGFRKAQGQPSQFLTVFFNDGTNSAPQWKPVTATTATGDSILAPSDVNSAPRLTVGDWNNDGKPDLVVAIEHKNRNRPGRPPHSGRQSDGGVPRPGSV